MALVETKVEAIIKNISNKNTISVIEDILNSGDTLFLPLNIHIKMVRLNDLKIPMNSLPFDTQLYPF